MLIRIQTAAAAAAAARYVAAFVVARPRHCDVTSRGHWAAVGLDITLTTSAISRLHEATLLAPVALDNFLFCAPRSRHFWFHFCFVRCPRSL